MLTWVSSVSAVPPSPPLDFAGAVADWEYPNARGIGCNTMRTSDSANFLSFLQVLRSTFGSSGLLTAAVSTTGFAGADGKPLASFAAFANYLDYINLMTVCPPADTLNLSSWCTTFSTTSGARCTTK